MALGKLGSRGGFGSAGHLGGASSPVIPAAAILDENSNPLRDENNQIITDEAG